MLANKFIIQLLLKADRELKSMISVGMKLWEDHQIILHIQNAFKLAQRKLIDRAIWFLDTKTTLSFVLVSKNQIKDFPQRIVIVKPNAKNICHSTTGKPKGKQKTGEMNLGKNCNLQTIIHKLDHVIGLSHEHQRPKRRQYLNAITDTKNEHQIKKVINKFGANLAANLHHNLDIQQNYNALPAYDYRSVMHDGS